MKFKVHINPKELLGELNEFQEKQLPYVMQQSLNKLANIAQAAERKHMKEVFTGMQLETFVLRGVKIEKTDRATKSTWRVVIQLAYPNARTFMDEHEEGDTRHPIKGRYIWVRSRKWRKSSVQKDNNLSPKNIRLRPAGRDLFKGDNGVFMVRNRKTGDMQVFQRTSKPFDRLRNNDGTFKVRGGRKRKPWQGIRKLYTLISRARIPARLEFVKTIQSSVWANQDQVMNEAMDNALKLR